MRVACIDRKTAETDISLTLNLDGSGKSDIDSGCGFLDHMLTLFASHGRFDLSVRCKGDTNVDYQFEILQNPDYQAGNFDIEFLNTHVIAGVNINEI